MLRLERPNIVWLQSYLLFIEEMRQLGEIIWEGMLPKPGEIAEQFVSRLNSEEVSDPGFVPATNYWAVENDTVVGRISLRHQLNEKLEEFGGHIGYEVRPSCRRRGFATEMLRLALRTAKAKEIGRLLLTCSPDNVASNKTIQANGGVLVKTAYSEQWKRETCYYWISL